MNIVIFGAGARGRLGQLLGLRAQEEGHRVISISHREYPGSPLEVIAADFSSIDSVANAYLRAVEILGHVDRVVYCSKNPHNSAVDITLQNTTRIMKESQQSLLVDVGIPHKILTIAQQQESPCHFAFFTTQLALEFGNDEQRNYSTYIGGKAWQLHLVRALVKNDKSKVTATMFSIHFAWDGSASDKQKLEKLYDLVLYYTENGRIVNAYSMINVISH